MEIGSTNRTHKKDYEQAIAGGARLCSRCTARIFR